MDKIQKQTNEHNNTMRGVIHKHSYDLNKFISQSDGNLLINGGTKDKRRECLLRLICHERAKNNSSVIIFSDDDILKSDLINLAQNNKIGNLVVCSEEYPNYDFFCEMNNNLICDYFCNLALEKGIRDTSELNSFLDAFLTILSQQSPINLSAIKYFSKNTDTNIKDSADDAQVADALISSPKGSVTARNLINKSLKAFSPITSEDCSSGVCIKRMIDRDCVFLIDTPLYDSEFFAFYFAMELKALTEKNFMCIFDDSIFLNNECMMNIVNVMKQRQHVNVILSYKNIMAVSDDTEILKNFNRDIILLNGNTPYVDLQLVLSSFGQYTHMTPMANQNTPPALLFTLYRGEGKSAVPYVRDRIILQEEYGNEALLRSGSNPQILITKKLFT